jgi:hypothetical protein
MTAGTDLADEFPLEDGDPRAEITRIEEKIEELAATAERCRKMIVAARIAMTAGAVWMVVALLGIVPFNPATMVASIAAVIGGIVVFGSNTATAKLTATAIEEAEAARAELIGSLRLRVVGGGNTR